MTVCNIFINSRDGLIALGNRLGEVLRDKADIDRKVILLGADEKSGKSLLAMAVDQVFNPANYSLGITEYSLADEVLAPNRTKRRQIIFENFRGTSYCERSDIDRFYRG